MKPPTPTPAPTPAVQVVPFVAASAADAVAQIRARLGPDAVVVNVRQLPAGGIAKLWKSPRIEVLAYKPEPAAGPAPATRAVPSPGSAPISTAAALLGPDEAAWRGPDGLPVPASAPPLVSAVDGLAELRKELRALKEQLGPPGPSAAQPGSPASGAASADEGAASGRGRLRGGARRDGTPTWRVGEVLESSGLLPVHVQRVVDQLQKLHGEVPPGSLAEELLMARSALSGFWRSVSDAGRGEAGPHVLIGSPGAGKTTCICKWLAQACLLEGRTAHVWRLDTGSANTAEALSVYCEILGVPSERTWSGAAAARQADLSFVDLPGVDWRNGAAVQELRRRIEDLGPCRVHLVLNAAYEVNVLLAQARAFSGLPVDDLILTHLDEEPRWGKLWNVVLGTKYPVRFLSAAQNVPGEFLPATAERILTRQFPA